MKVSVATFLALLCGCLSHPARAEIIRVKFSGFIQSGEDISNIFGGGDLTGKRYTVAEYFNLDNADNAINHEGDASPFLPYFFAGCGSATSCASGTLQVGSATFDFGLNGSEYGSFTREQGKSFQASLLDRGGSKFYEAQLLTMSNGQTLSGLFQTTEGSFGDGTGSTIVLGNGKLLSTVPLPGSLPLFGAALFGLLGIRAIMIRHEKRWARGVSS